MLPYFLSYSHWAPAQIFAQSDFKFFQKTLFLLPFRYVRHSSVLKVLSLTHYSLVGDVIVYKRIEKSYSDLLSFIKSAAWHMDMVGVTLIFVVSVLVWWRPINRYTLRVLLPARSTTRLKVAFRFVSTFNLIEIRNSRFSLPCLFGGGSQQHQKDSLVYSMDQYFFWVAVVYVFGLPCRISKNMSSTNIGKKVSKATLTSHYVHCTLSRVPERICESRI
jgi:hypothetical protein